jgi:predicted amidohydrolase
MTAGHLAAHLKLGAFQFAGSGDVEANLRALEGGIEQASAAGVRLLVTQECAVTGYPPVETPSAAGIDFAAAERAAARVQALATLHGLFAVLGTVVPHQGGFRSSSRRTSGRARWRTT